MGMKGGINRTKGPLPARDVDTEEDRRLHNAGDTPENLKGVYCQAQRVAKLVREVGAANGMQADNGAVMAAARA